MKVKDAMHRNVTWIEPATLLTDVAKKMRELDIGAIPVGENDRLIGMITDRDLAIRAFNGHKDIKSLTARDVMTAGVVYCHDEDKLKDAVHLMEEKKVRRLPVIDSKKRMVGMLALGDLAHVSREMAGETLAAVSAHH